MRKAPNKPALIKEETLEADIHVTNQDDFQHVVEIRAFELFLERAGQDGDELTDWLKAEMEIRSALAIAATPVAATKARRRTTQLPASKPAKPRSSARKTKQEHPAGMIDLRCHRPRARNTIL